MWLITDFCLAVSVIDMTVKTDPGCLFLVDKDLFCTYPDITLLGYSLSFHRMIEASTRKSTKEGSNSDVLMC